MLEVWCFRRTQTPLQWGNSHEQIIKPLTTPDTETNVDLIMGEYFFIILSTDLFYSKTEEKMLRTKEKSVSLCNAQCCIELYSRLITFSDLWRGAIHANGIFFDVASTEDICTQGHNLYPISLGWLGGIWGNHLRIDTRSWCISLHQFIYCRSLKAMR